MLERLHQALDPLLGLSAEPSQLTAGQLSLRSLIIFVFGVAVVRFAHKRLFGRFAALDMVLGVMLGSILGRAVNGSAPFFPTLAAVVVLVVLHSLTANLARRSHRFGVLVKGHDRVLVQDGKTDAEALRKTDMSEGDLLEELRLQGKVEDVAEVKKAVLERSGQVSVVAKKKEPKVLEVRVEAGVQVVRLEIG